MVEPSDAANRTAPAGTPTNAGPDEFADSGETDDVAAASGSSDGSDTESGEPLKPDRGEEQEQEQEQEQEGFQQLLGSAWFEDELPISASAQDDPPATSAAAARRPHPEPRAAAAVPAQTARASMRSRFGREAIGVAVLALLAVVCAALIVAVVLKTQNDAAAAAREAAAYTPPPLASASPAPSGPIIAVVSDETALRASDGTTAAERWPQVLGSRLDARVIPFASAGGGYATAGANGDTFANVAATVPATANVVVFVGGGADGSVSSLSLARAATEAFSAAAKQAPDATIIAVGPLFAPSGESGDEIDGVRSALQSAARIAGVRWVDPIRLDWLQDVTTTSDLTPAVQRTIATRMERVVGSGAG